MAGEWAKRDRYGRILGKVVSGGRDVCLEPVRPGMAWHYKHFQGEQSPEDRRLYAEAETEARAARWGLWADLAPTPPCDFRRGGRPPTRSAQTSGGSREDAGVASEPAVETVYVTRTGEKYHREGCRCLRGSRIPTPLREARKRFGPCSVCRPPP